MQKRSRRFGLIGILAAAACLACAVCMATGCGPETEREESPSLAPQDTEPEAAIELPTEPFYALIVGNDSREGTLESSGGPYSDTIMLTRVDPTNYQITLLSVPRDYGIWIDDVKVKLNDSYARSGIDLLREKIRAITGEYPEYYFDMGFLDFINFINDLDGVHVNVPVNMSLKNPMTGSKIYLDAGEQDLDGEQALVFARVRKIFQMYSDACRQIDDRSIVEALLRKVAADPASVSDAVDALYKAAETNWNRAEFEALVKDFAAHADQLTIISGTGPYNGDIDPEFGYWLVIDDEETWANVMDLVNSGGDPKDALALPEMILE